MPESLVPPLAQFQPDNLRIWVNMWFFPVCNHNDILLVE